MSHHLWKICESYYFPQNPRIRTEKTKSQYRFAIQDFERTLGRTATVDDLTDENVVAMVTRMRREKRLDGRPKYAPKTINERRGRINALWGFLSRKGRAANYPTVARLPEPAKIPLAWTKQELSRLLKACSDQRGSIGGVAACSWWYSLHLAMWDCGERIGAMLQIEWSHLSESDGVWWLIVPAEVRKGQTADRAYRLSPETLASLESIRLPRRRLIWPWPYSPDSVWSFYRRLRESAGLPTDHRSSFHRMRRSVASHFEAAGGNATELLGHSDRRVTRQSYLDPRFAKSPQATDRLFRLVDPGWEK